jgi:CRISPR/Cas system-associated exonuclease Cas4 (RecB family)
MFKHVDHEFKFETLNKIEGTDGRFYITPSGAQYPSITTVLGSFTKHELEVWKQKVGKEYSDFVSRMATNRGTRIHKVFEDYLDNKEIPKLSFIDQGNFSSMKPVLDRWINNIWSQECHLYSHHLQLAGQVDCIGEFDNRLSVIDFKTSKEPKHEGDIETYFMQATAYTIMFEEMTGVVVNRIVILISVDFDKPQIFVKNRREYINKLLEIRKLYKEIHNV